MQLKTALMEENEMNYCINMIFLGATKTCPFQIILMVLPTKTQRAIIQSTINRQPIESQEDYWKRITAKALELIEPHGNNHIIVMFCRNYPLHDHLSNDIMQNAARQKWFAATHQENHYMHIKALCSLLEHYD